MCLTYTEIEICFLLNLITNSNNWTRAFLIQILFNLLHSYLCLTNARNADENFSMQKGTDCAKREASSVQSWNWGFAIEKAFVSVNSTGRYSFPSYYNVAGQLVNKLVACHIWWTKPVCHHDSLESRICRIKGRLRSHTIAAFHVTPVAVIKYFIANKTADAEFWTDRPFGW